MDNIFKNNIYKIFELFIEHPHREFSIRGIARLLKLNHATIIRYIRSLVNLKLINKRESALYPTYYANTENLKYKSYKRNYIIFQIEESGLIDYIHKQTLASAIVLFGSCAKATFTEESDIDLFIESKKSKLHLSIYEDKLKRKINVLFESNINELSKELRNNIINGILLYGFIKINEGTQNA